MESIHPTLTKKDVKITICNWFDLENTRILTDYAQNLSRPGLGENRRLVTDEPVEFEK